MSDQLLEELKAWGSKESEKGFIIYESAFEWKLEFDTGDTFTGVVVGDTDINISDLTGVLGGIAEGNDKPVQEEIQAFFEAAKPNASNILYPNYNRMPSFIKFMILTSVEFPNFKGTVGTEISNLYSDISGIYFSNPDSNEGKIIVHRSKRFLRNFVLSNGLGIVEDGKSIAKEISSQENEIFSKYRNILIASGGLNDNSDPFKTKDSLNLLNEFLLKQKGDSEYLNKLFGRSIANAFDLRTFKLAIDKHIKEYIDNGKKPKVKVPIPTYSGGDTIRYLDYDNPEEQLETEYSKVNKLKDSLIYKEAYINAGKKLGTITPFNIKLDYREVDPDWPLTNTPVYDRPTSFGKIEVVSAGRDIYEPDHTTSDVSSWGGIGIDTVPDIFDADGNVIGKWDSKAPLGSIYNPLNRQEAGWIWGFNTVTDAPTGVDDLIFGHYMRFIKSIQDQLEGDNRLETTIGTIFRAEARDTANHIYPIVAGIWTEFTIFVKFREITEKKEDFLKTLTSDDMNSLEKEAKQSLENMSTSDIMSDKELTSEDIEKRQKLYKQCALLLNAHNLKKQYNADVVKKYADDSSNVHQFNYFNGRFWMVEDGVNSNSVLNKLVNPPQEQARPFLDITPDIHAALHPRLRLHKVYEAKEDGEKIIKTHEVPFDSFYPKHRADGLSIGEGTFDKGAGFGIKEFSFSFDGETPATAQKFVKAKLSLFFQTFNDFIKVRKVVDGEEEYEFRYLDLFVNTKFCPQTGVNSFSPLYYDPSFYRLRVDVGWEPRNDNQFAEILQARGTSPAEFNQTLNKTNKTFYLNLIDHTININEDGTITVDADYIAYMQGVLQSNSFNALSTRYTRERQKEYVKEYEKLLSKNSCTEEELAELVAAINSINDKIARSLHQGIVKKLILADSLYSVNIESGDINDFRNRDFFSKIPELKSKIGTPDKKKSVANASNEKQLNSAIQTDFILDSDYQENSKIYFFFMGDLLYHILDSLYKEDGLTQIKEAENLKLILSSFSYKNPFLTKECYLNIGEIPIDLDTFLSWYEQEIIKKEITTMPILTFIKRLLHYLIQDVFLETCINRQEHKRLAFQTTTFLADSEDGQDPMDWVCGFGSSKPVCDLSKEYGTGENNSLPLKTGVDTTGAKRTDELYNYLFIFPHYRSAEHEGRGIASVDENRGVYHLYIGADRGLTKKISFSKSDIQYIRESRMMQQGSNGLLQLSSVYRASISMIGNTLFYPGMEVYVNPFGFGGLEFGMPYDGPGSVENPNLSNIMGIGGYYQIMKVNSRITPGSFTTDIDAHFVYSGDGKPLGRDGLKKVELCGDVKDIKKGEEDNSCGTVILNIENELINTDVTSTDKVDSKEGDSN